jgi:hypothetical protein
MRLRAAVGRASGAGALLRLAPPDQPGAGGPGRWPRPEDRAHDVRVDWVTMSDSCHTGRARTGELAEAGHRRSSHSPQGLCEQAFRISVASRGSAAQHRTQATRRVS